MDTVQRVVAFIAEHSDFSDAVIADKVGCSQPTIWRLKNGKSHSCSSDLYLKLCALRDSLKKDQGAESA